METTVTLNQTVQNPENRTLSFNSEIVCGVTLTSQPDGTASVTFKVTPEIEEALIRTLRSSLGQSS